MRDLEPLRLKAHGFLGSASFDLRMTSARLTPTDVLAGLHLAQIAARVNVASKRDLLGLRNGPKSPEQADLWLMAAARLHDAVSDAADVAILLWEEAENGRRIVTPAGDAQVGPDDARLFGFVPTEEAYEGWTSPLDVSDLQDLGMPVQWAAWNRREDIVKAVNAWGVEHQRAVEASGIVILRECCTALDGVLVDIRAAVRDVRPNTVAASRAIARIAARSLVEIGDDARDLARAAREYVDVLGPNEPSALAWQAVLGLLITAPES